MYTLFAQCTLYCNEIKCLHIQNQLHQNVPEKGSNIVSEYLLQLDYRANIIKIEADIH